MNLFAALDPARTLSVRTQYGLRPEQRMPPPLPTERRCRGCSDVKHRAFFRRSTVWADGLDTLCRVCRRAQEKRAADKHRRKKQEAGE